MKKFIKSYLLAILVVCGFMSNAYTCNLNGPDLITGSNVLEVERRAYDEEVLPGGIKKKYNVIYLKYDYGEEFAKSNYKYKTVRVETTYYDTQDNNNEIIASVYMEFNFRYSTSFDEAKCLSTVHGQSLCNDKYDIKVFSRTKNSSYDFGEGFGTIILTKDGIIQKQIDSFCNVFSCDSSGDIVQRA